MDNTHKPNPDLGTLAVNADGSPISIAAFNRTSRCLLSVETISRQASVVVKRHQRLIRTLAAEPKAPCSPTGAAIAEFTLRLPPAALIATMENLHQEMRSCEDLGNGECTELGGETLGNWPRIRSHARSTSRAFRTLVLMVAIHFGIDPEDSDANFFASQWAAVVVLLTASPQLSIGLDA